MKFTIFLGLVLLSSARFAQDTNKYNGILGDNLLYESIELYPDSTFKWTSEYDLSFSSYGQYSIEDNRLLLNHYFDWGKPKTMTVADSIATMNKPTKSDLFIMGDGKMYRTNNSGKKKMRIKDRSLKTPWSWLFGLKYVLIKEE